MATAQSDSEMDVDLELNVGENTAAVRQVAKKSNKKKLPNVTKTIKATVKKIVTPKTSIVQKPRVKLALMQRGGFQIPKTKQSESPATPNLNKSTVEMITEALVNLKTQKGITLPAIYKYIKEHFDPNLTKRRENLIKKFLHDEHEAGNLRNKQPHADGKLKLNGRFIYTAPK